jgi:hypothetical protein
MLIDAREKLNKLPVKPFATLLSGVSFLIKSKRPTKDFSSLKYIIATKQSRVMKVT